MLSRVVVIVFERGRQRGWNERLIACGCRMTLPALGRFLDFWCEHAERKAIFKASLALKKHGSFFQRWRGFAKTFLDGEIERSGQTPEGQRQKNRLLCVCTVSPGGWEEDGSL